MKKVYVLLCVCLAVFGCSSVMAAVPVTSGLVLQLDTSSVTTTNVDGVDYVTSWNDLSGNSNNAVAIADGNRPAIVSNFTPVGGSAVKFDGLGDYLSITPNSTLDGGNWTIFAVYASGGIDSGNGSDKIINFGYADIDPDPAVTKAHPLVYGMVANGTNFGVRATSRSITGTGIFGSTVPVAGYAANTFYTGIATIDNASTNATAYMINSAGTTTNGAATGSTSVGSGNSIATVGCGTAGASSWIPGAFFNGYIAELLVYNRVLDSSELTSVSDYLLAKHMPPMAYNPTPANAAYCYDRDISLKWTPANGVTSQTLYFSTDYNSVRDSLPSALKATLASDAASYPIADLQMSTKYYWRINQVVNGSTVYGQVWSFDVPAYYRVDNFEDYIGTGNSSTAGSLREDWKDGWSMDPGTELGSFAVLVDKTAGATDANTKGEVRTLKKSLLLAFDNTGGGVEFAYPGGFTDYFTPAQPYAELNVSLASLPIGTDWTIQGDWTLEVYFYGLTTNGTSSPLYLLLEDASGHIGTPIVYPTSSDIAVAEWHKWEICPEDLATNNVDLSNLSKMYIGFGNRNNPQVGSKGSIYIDDIRMHREVMLATDLNKDCRVNFEDFAILALDWLMHAGCAN
jgi:hypothetical protein